MDQKFQEAMLYFINRQDVIRHLGRTKLAKLLFFADFEHFAEHHTSITGVEYVKKEHGPFPSGCVFYEALDALEAECAVVISEEIRGDFERETYEPCRQADLSSFSAGEKAILEKTTQKYKDLNSNEIKHLSHATPSFVLTKKQGDVIDYSLAYY